MKLAAFSPGHLFVRLFVLVAWSAIVVAGALVAWPFMMERGFSLDPVRGTDYDVNAATYSKFFGAEGARAALVLRAKHEPIFPLITMSSEPTCSLVHNLQFAGDKIKLQFTCQNETAMGNGCITLSQLHKQIVSKAEGLLEHFMQPDAVHDLIQQHAREPSQLCFSQVAFADLQYLCASRSLGPCLQLQLFFPKPEVEPLIDAAPNVVACPQVADSVLNRELTLIASDVQTRLDERLPHCNSSVLSFWQLEPQQIHRSIPLPIWGQNFTTEISLQLPPGTFWSLFTPLNSPGLEEILMSVQTSTCHGLPVEGFSSEALEVVDVLEEMAADASKSGLQARVMSFGKIVLTIRDGVEKVMGLSTALFPLGIAVLAYMVGNGRLAAIAVVNVIAALTGSVLIMHFFVSKIMTVSLFTPAFAICVVLAMSIDYSLFLLTRFQTEVCREARDAKDAVWVMMATSGTVVAQAGLTLACCFCCVFIIPVPLISAMGAGGLASVFTATMATLTLTPVLILCAPTFWTKSCGSCRCWPRQELQATAPSRLPFWERFAKILAQERTAKSMLLLLVVLAVACVWVDLAAPEDTVGFLPALPEGSETAEVLQDVGRALGFGSVFPTEIVIISPPGVDFPHWRREACQALKSIAVEVASPPGKFQDFTDSAFVGPVMIGGTCLVDIDVNATGMQWVNHSGQKAAVIHVDYGVNPLSALGREWTVSLERAVERHQVGTWFVRGYGPIMSNQAHWASRRFPYLLCSMVAAILIIPSIFTRSVVSSLRALFCLTWMLIIVWAVTLLIFPSGIYYIVLPMMLPFVVGISLDYDIFYTEAVLERCKEQKSTKEAGLHALVHTANMISAAGIIMIIAFLPLLVSSTLMMRQIGLVAILSLLMNATVSTKLLMPLCVQVLGHATFWPRQATPAKMSPDGPDGRVDVNVVPVQGNETKKPMESMDLDPRV